MLQHLNALLVVRGPKDCPQINAHDSWWFK